MNWFHASQITKQRLGLWQKRLENEKVAATPAVLVSVRHEKEHLGEIVISTTEDLPDNLILAALKKAVADLERPQPERN